MPDMCDRCGFPAVQDAAGNWVHAELADAVFCATVMQAHPLAAGDHCGCCGGPGTAAPRGDHDTCCADLHDVSASDG